MDKLIEEFIKFKQIQAIKEYESKKNSINLWGLALFFTLITGFVYSAYENTKLPKPTVNQSNK